MKQKARTEPVKSLTVQAPAKINLFLKICSQRDDGYHNIETVFQKISLFDEITLAPTPGPGISITTDDSSIPQDNTNLAYRAAELLLRHLNINPGLSIHIKKNIPSGAGLGGGSSDAAGTLLGLVELLNLRVPSRTLRDLAKNLGADVPFFLYDFSTAYATGIGEIITEMNMNVRPWLLIICPELFISTAWAYKALKKYNVLTKSKLNIKINEFIATYEGLGRQLYNDFEHVVYPEYPQIKKIKEEIQLTDPVGALLSGSGAALYGLYKTRRDAETAQASIANSQQCRTHIAGCI
ncbi:MAG: 4-(cytidine 5'-diphospho)-2-C-methyl-D-erythritol kinase [Deltaproteobacteria bacterium]|nr:4-(cytidine 5'-diphospho)-2-C-methyl-D-erythritol kinase [Deltaproteobacteria bacterium]